MLVASRSLPPSVYLVIPLKTRVIVYRVSERVRVSGLYVPTILRVSHCEKSNELDISLLLRASFRSSSE